MKKLEHLIPPPLLMIATAVAMWAEARWQPATPLPSAWRHLGAISFSAVALIFGSSGIRAFLLAHTTINPVRIEEASRLVTSGIYRVTRDPMYVGLTAVLFAWAFWLGGVWSFLGPVAFAFFMQRFQILPEERMLQSKFGREYEIYRQQVRRWL